MATPDCFLCAGLFSSKPRRLFVVMGLSLMLLILTALPACESDSGGGTTGSGDDATGSIDHETPAQVTRAEPMSVDEFKALLTKPELAAVMGRVEGEATGAITFTWAGLLDDQKGNELRFAELVDEAGRGWVLVRACDGEACLAATLERAGKDVIWRGSDGGELSPPKLGAPALLKQLPGNNFGDPTTVVFSSGLSGSPETSGAGSGGGADDDFPVVNVVPRRFVIANAWGPLFDLDLSALTAAATASGRFDSVETYDYATFATLDQLMIELKDGDVLVWFGAGVRMRATSDGKYKTVGMTTARAILGDETLHVGRARDLLEGNPFRDLALPSLLVLAGSETWGDGQWDPIADDDAVSPDSFVRNLQNADHQVVAIEGGVDSLALTASLDALFACLFDGEALGACLEAGNLALSRRDVDAALKRLPIQDDPELPDLRLPVPETDYWATTQATAPPLFAEMYLRIGIQYKCIGPDGAVYDPDTWDDMVQNLYIRDIEDFDGSTFSKDWVYETGGVDLRLNGRLGGLEAGERFLFSVSGDVSDRMRGVQLYGLAHVTEIRMDIDSKGHYVEVRFTGNLSASSFSWSPDGINDELCQLALSDDSSEAMSYNSEPSWIKLYY